MSCRPPDRGKTVTKLLVLRLLGLTSREEALESAAMRPKQVCYQGALRLPVPGASKVACRKGRDETPDLANGSCGPVLNA